MPWWMCLLTLVADVLLILILIWPLSALGKEKLYIYFCRYFAYLIGVNFYRSENWNPTDNTLKAQEGLLEADKPKTSNLTSEPPQTRKNELKTKRKVKS
jgi:hypothetical protein